MVAEAAPNVQEVVVGDEKSDTETSDVTQVQKSRKVSCTNKLEIESIAIHTESLDAVISHSPRLLALNINSVKIIGNLFESLIKAGRVFPQLLGLAIQSQQLDKHFILQIRTLFPNLVVLRIENCTGLSACESVEVTALPEWQVMQEIKIVDCDINLAGVKALIFKAFKLTKLEFYRCLIKLTMTAEKFPTTSCDLFYKLVLNYSINGSLSMPPFQDGYVSQIMIYLT